MKTTFKSIIAAACYCLISATGSSVFAQQAPTDVPPAMDKLDEVADPAVSTTKKAAAKQTEQTIQNGEQTEVKVTNGIGTYIVKPNQSVGNSLPGDAQSSSNHAAQWVIKSWGGSKSTEPKDDEPPVLQPNPNALPPQK
jgi:hypothetical protein